MFVTLIEVSYQVDTIADWFIMYAGDFWSPHLCFSHNGRYE
jgi:hypothetical protein